MVLMTYSSYVMTKQMHQRHPDETSFSFYITCAWGSEIMGFRVRGRFIVITVYFCGECNGSVRVHGQ